MKAIYALYPNVVTIKEELDGSVLGYDQSNNLVTINKSLVDAWVDPNAWAENRKVAYPPINEQLDMQYWDGVNNTTTWADAIAKVKLDNPKPE
tara:strand:+ start:578 stop:856 length:279 start_codon:yes stop_codon:yes gene_type:complete